MLKTKGVEKIKTQILRSLTFFPPKIVPFVRECRKMWWSQGSRRWQYGGALHAGLVMLHACKHTHRPYLSVQCWSCVDAYSMTRICLYRHWLQWKLQPVTAESANSLFIALVTAALESTFVLLGDDKGHQFFSRVNKNYTLFFLPCKRGIWVFVHG